jgi:3-methylcrotonyl-CoA carboxylase beta subunit
VAEKTDKKMSLEQKKELEYEENRKHWLSEEEKIYELWEKAYNPGGQAQNERLHKQGKKLPRQLIKQLVDPGTEFFELSRGAGFGIDYELAKDVPSAGLVTGIGKVHGN